MDSSALEEIKVLEEKLLACPLPSDLHERTKNMVVRLDRLAKMGGNYAVEYDNVSRYVDWITSLPWKHQSEDSLDINNAEKVLNKNHYGLLEAKKKILEYLAILKLTTDHRLPTTAVDSKQSLQSSASPAGLSQPTIDRKPSRAPILALVGLVGTGKTTLAYSVASAMGRKFERIPFGGIGDALYLRGQSRAYADAEPGVIIKALRRAGTKNPVILLDEIDRVTESGRATIMGVLVELLDPGQNHRFVDHFIDFPFDLSQVLFIATANNTTNISTAVLDRLEVIQMPSYTDEEKITIGQEFILPRALSDSGLPTDAVQVGSDIWPKIVRPLGYDSGIRTLERTINGMIRKVALDFVSGKNHKVVIDESNLPQYIAS